MRTLFATVTLFAALLATAVGQDFSKAREIGLGLGPFVVARGPVTNDGNVTFQKGDKCVGRYEDVGVVLAETPEEMALRYKTTAGTFDQTCPNGMLFVLSNVERRTLEKQRLQKGRSDDANFRMDVDLGNGSRAH